MLWFKKKFYKLREIWCTCSFTLVASGEKSESIPGSGPETLGNILMLEQNRHLSPGKVDTFTDIWTNSGH